MSSSYRIYFLTAQNISYGKPGATQKEIEAAAAQAGAHEFITNLPEVSSGSKYKDIEIIISKIP